MDAQQVSRLTASWIEDLPGEGSTVVSGLGVWPLLAILAELADGPARGELAAAAGGRYTGPLQVPGLRMAAGLWTLPDVPLEPDVDRLVPPDCRGVLTGPEELDYWVKDQTNGLLDRMPIELGPEVLLVLASALAVKTQWKLPFSSYPQGGREWLGRADHELETLRRYESPAGPLTVVTVRGSEEIDVELVLAEPERSRGAVLAAVLRRGGSEGVAGEQLLASRGVGELVAPGVEVIGSMVPVPTVALSMPAFEITAEHDLLAHAGVFGLVSAQDTSRGHFPGLSSRPLAVSQAKQAVLARFSATGFEAAAVTALAAVAGSALLPGGRALQVTLDRPFGFVAVHRPTGIPLVAGWSAN